MLHEGLGFGEGDAVFEQTVLENMRDGRDERDVGGRWFFGRV